MHIVLSAIFLLLVSGTAMAETLTLVLDTPNVAEQPLFFRRCDGPYLKTPATPPTRSGLGNCRFSGSHQFSALGLDALLRALPANPVIIDLRQESHGFIDGMAVSWYAPKDFANVGKTLLQIEIDEGERLALLARTGIAVVTEVKAKDAEGALGESSMFTVVSRDAQTEKQLLAGKGVRYLRLPVTDHMAPPDAVVDAFLRFYRAQSIDTWLHFHCHAGQGRTTTFMVMADMLVNATLVSAEDIVWRQELLGGLNLFSHLPPGWKKPLAQERAEFLKRFHEYATDNPRGRPQLWSEWLAWKGK